MKLFVSSRLALGIVGWASLASQSTVVEAVVQGEVEAVKLLTKPCVIEALDFLLLPGVDHSNRIVGEQFECLLDAADAPGGVPGLSFPIQGEDFQIQQLRSMMHGGELISGVSKLDMEVGLDENEVIKLPAGEDVMVLTPPNHTGRRRLSQTTGESSVLVVKVYDKNGLSVPDTPAEISDNVFGTSGDSSKSFLALS
jgi:hypothetical protein